MSDIQGTKKMEHSSMKRENQFQLQDEPHWT